MNEKSDVPTAHKDSSYTTREELYVVRATAHGNAWTRNQIRHLLVSDIPLTIRQQHLVRIPLQKLPRSYPLIRPQCAHAVPQPSLAPVSEPPTTIYIFRIAMTRTSWGLSVIPPTVSANKTQAKPTIYPLSTAHWCIMRLRATC